jgi:hypothetical protein
MSLTAPFVGGASLCQARVSRTAWKSRNCERILCTAKEKHLEEDDGRVPPHESQPLCGGLEHLWPVQEPVFLAL